MRRELNDCKKSLFVIAEYTEIGKVGFQWHFADFRQFLRLLLGGDGKPPPIERA